MRRFFPTTIFLLFILPAVGSAQTWTPTPEQQEVVAHIKQCWDAWERAFAEQDSDIFREACPIAPDAAGWFTNNGTPAKGFDSEFRTLDKGLLKGLWSDCTWQDLRPLSIRIEDDVAVVHFYAHFVCMGTDKKANFIEEKRLEIFKRGDGGWIFIGGMVTPVGSDEE